MKRRIRPHITRPDSNKSDARIKSTKSDSNFSQGIISSISKPPISQQSTSNPRTSPSKSKIKRDYKILNVENYTEFAARYKSKISTVYFVKDKRTNKFYAAKSSEEDVSEVSMIHLLREINILMQTQHQTIIQFEGISFSDFEGKDRITIFMNYAENKSLASLIDKSTRSLLPSDFDDTNWQIIIIGIAYGMMILHQNNIIHRDLKPENILIDNEFKPRITDFGYSKIFDPKNPMNQSGSGIGTLKYISPQNFYDGVFDIKTDVYSFGIILYEVATKSRAYSDYFKRYNDNRSNFKFFQDVYNGMRPEFDEKIDINKNIKELIMQCWDFDPNIRPFFSEIFEKLSLSKNGSDGNYLLTESVDVDRILDYVEEITSVTIENDKNESDSRFKEIELENQKLIQSNYQLNKDKKQLTSENMQLIEDKKKLTSENTQLSEDKKKLTSEKIQLIEDKKKLASENMLLTRDVNSQLLEYENRVNDLKRRTNQLKEELIQAREYIKNKPAGPVIVKL